MAPYLKRAEASGRSQVAAIGVAQEFQRVQAAYRRETSTAAPQFTFAKADRRVTCYLPQLINVLRGEMSLVGPRPALPDETAQYGDLMRRRLAVKPGLTGLWQVSGRSDLSWEEAVRLDLRYVENWSLALDLQILWKTGSAVFQGSGAY